MLFHFTFCGGKNTQKSYTVRFILAPKMVNDSVASVIGQHDLGVGGAAVNGLKLSDPVPR